MRSNHPHRGRTRRAAAGFTLIELMIACGIVAILASIAISTYRNQTLRANRTDGRTILMQIQLAEQKFFLQNNTYTVNIAAAPPVGLGMPAVSPRGYYAMAVAPGNTGIGTSFVASATAQANQVKDDPNCLIFTVDDSGNRTPDDTATACWH